MLNLIEFVKSYFQKTPKAEISLENLFEVVYYIVDEFYRLTVGSQKNLRRSNNNDPDFTDAEVITIALVGELTGENSENAWWNTVYKNYRHLFPDLCSRTRYGRRLKKLRLTTEKIRQQFLFQMDATVDRYRLTDSFPLRLARLARLSGSSKPFEYMASVGYCASLKERFYGFKVDMMTDLRGVPTTFVLTPANEHDTEGLRQLLNEMAELGYYSLSVIVVGDKGFVGEDYAAELKKKYGIELLSMQRHYDKELPDSALNGLLRTSRKVIETTFSVLTRVFNANWTHCRSAKGLITRMVTKITAFNLGNLLNFLTGQPILEIKGFAN